MHGFGTAQRDGRLLVSSGARELVDRGPGGRVTVDHGDFISVEVGAVSMGFQKVEDRTPGKNRIHLDLFANDREAECDRLVALGARHLEDHAVPGFGWTVLADPEGNQFCVAQP